MQLNFGTQNRFVGINNDNTTITTLGSSTITGPDAAACQITGNNGGPTASPRRSSG